MLLNPQFCFHCSRWEPCATKSLKQKSEYCVTASAFTSGGAEYVGDVQLCEDCRTACGSHDSLFNVFFISSYPFARVGCADKEAKENTSDEKEKMPQEAYWICNVQSMTKAGGHYEYIDMNCFTQIGFDFHVLCFFLTCLLCLVTAPCLCKSSIWNKASYSPPLCLCFHECTPPLLVYKCPLLCWWIYTGLIQQQGLIKFSTITYISNGHAARKCICTSTYSSLLMCTNNLLSVFLRSYNTEHFCII